MGLAHVRVEVGLAARPVGAVGAGVGPVARVRAKVVLEVVQACEGFPTHTTRYGQRVFAAVRPCPCPRGDGPGGSPAV